MENSTDQAPIDSAVAQSGVPLVLSLEGFEPDRGSLRGQALYAVELLGCSASKADIANAAEAVERAFGACCWSSALVELGVQIPDGLSTLRQQIERVEMGGGRSQLGSPRAEVRRLLATLGSNQPVFLSVMGFESFPLPFQAELASLGSTGSQEPGTNPGPQDSGSQSSTSMDLSLPSELRAVVDLVALCETVAPIEMVFEFLAIDSDHRDSLLDELDRQVEHGALRGVVQDLEYRHPGFGNSPVYRFVNSGVARAWAGSMDLGLRCRLAGDLIDFLLPRLDLAWRSSAILLASLGKYAPEHPRTQIGAHLLQLWVCRGDGQAKDLSAVLDGQLATNADLASCWLAALERVVQVWPVFRIELVLDAVQRIGSLLRADDLARSRFLRAVLLFRGRKLEAAQDAALEAAGVWQSVPTAPTRDRAAALSLAARCAAGLGSREFADEHWKAAGQLIEEEMGKVMELANILRQRADLAASGGDLTTALTLQQEALRIVEEIHGEHSSETAGVLRVAARFSSELGDRGGATQYLQRVVDMSLGNEPHGQQAQDLRWLADLFKEQERFSAAKIAQEKAIALEVVRLGENHPELAASWKFLASVCQELGEVNQTESSLLRALEIERAAPFPDDREVAHLETALTHVREQLARE